MQIAVIGARYVGLVTGTGFAEFGHDVTCVDVDHALVATLERGDAPFYEPGLQDMIRRNVARGRLRFTTEIATAVAGAEVVFIAVGTPSTGDGGPELQFVHAAATQIGAALTGFAVIVTKSTVPPGTAEAVRALVANATAHPFVIAANPEFLREGDAIEDFLRPARVVIGADDRRAVDTLVELYRGVLGTADRIQVMDLRSAELAKYAANSMLATRVSFMNELARLCEAIDADIDHVRAVVGADPRIGASFLAAGVGFGGSCLPKDLRALRHLATQVDVELRVVDAAERANQRQQRWLGDQILARLGPRVAGARVALWGLAFKPETDDIREAPALATIAQLQAAGAVVVAYDPVVSARPCAELAPPLELVTDPYLAATGADALALVTEWREFLAPDLERLRAIMRTPLVFDGRNAWSPAAMRAAGFDYYGLGRRAAGGPS
ncbi:MAG: UDP-glucose/GDP-mannose dehydrogenase family protein [Myxococcales bacterium]|nr:UDP-glucose/GDP-mannose dehydrogenase family protein [Myxococcales bacterium]